MDRPNWNPLLWACAIAVVFLSLATWTALNTITHNTPYAMKADVDKAVAELRTRINVDFSNQAIVNQNVTNELAEAQDRLDADDEDIVRLLRAKGLAPRKLKKHRNDQNQ